MVLTDPIYAGLLNRVRLAGGVPRLARLEPGRSGWRLDPEAFLAAVSQPKVRAVLMMSPSMPTGCVLSQEDWALITQACVERDLLLIYDAAMERILFDGRKVLHPAAFPGMAERTITVGAASKELRMIGWRVGWVVGPEALVADVGLVGMANVVCQVGIAMPGVAAALEAPASDVAEAVLEWQRRRDVLLEELDGLAGDSSPWRLVPAAGLRAPGPQRSRGFRPVAPASAHRGHTHGRLGHPGHGALPPLRLCQRALRAAARSRCPGAEGAQLTGRASSFR